MNFNIKKSLFFTLPLVIVGSVCYFAGKYESNKSLPSSPLVTSIEDSADINSAEELERLDKLFETDYVDTNQIKKTTKYDQNNSLELDNISSNDDIVVEYIPTPPPLLKPKPLSEIENPSNIDQKKFESRSNNNSIDLLPQVPIDNPPISYNTNQDTNEKYSGKSPSFDDYIRVLDAMNKLISTNPVDGIGSFPTNAVEDATRKIYNPLSE